MSKKESKNFISKPAVIKLEIGEITPIDVFNVFLKISEKTFLFENNENNQPAHSYLGVNPVEILRIKNGLISLEQENGIKILGGNPSEIIGNYLEKYNFGKIEGLPDFYGGVIGYIGYDFVSYLENIKLPENNSFNEGETCLMLFKEVIVFDHEGNELFIIVNNINSNNSPNPFSAKEKAEEIKTIIMSATKTNPPKVFDFENLLDIKTSFGEENFCKAVKKVKSYIKNGDIFQCVLSERFSFELDTEPFMVYQVLRLINPSPYLFYISTGKEVLLGSSPEMLVRANSEKLSMCPIAGTRPRGKTEKEDKNFERALLRSVKEKAEHLMLVDLGRNDAGKVSQPGTVTVKEFMKVEKFSAVMHLVSLVEGKIMKDKTSYDAFKAIFPAGTLSGAPKVRAMEIISETEPVRRGAYGGAVLCHSFSGYLDSCITIRSLFVNEKKAYIQAGAGIVADSNPKREYHEILNKSKAVLRAVNIAKKNYFKQEV